jgi:hypothetical protein
MERGLHMQAPWPTAGVVLVTLQMIHAEPDRPAGRPQSEQGDDAGLLNRVQCHRQCHCKDSIRKEGRPDLWDSACTPTAWGDQANGLIPPKFIKTKVSFTESSPYFGYVHNGVMCLSTAASSSSIPRSTYDMWYVSLLWQTSGAVPTALLKHSTVSLAALCLRTFQHILTRV